MHTVDLYLRTAAVIKKKKRNTVQGLSQDSQYGSQDSQCHLQSVYTFNTLSTVYLHFPTPVYSNDLIPLSGITSMISLKISSS